jgi:hypothetical protein
MDFSMQKISATNDVSGREMGVGDTVTTLNGDVTGKICDICEDSDVAFVRVRPLHQSYGKGIWHAADRTMWLSASRKPAPAEKEKETPAEEKTAAAKRPSQKQKN